MKKFVVIGGMYRSGTTLAETIIGSHPDISIPPRDFAFFEYYKSGKSLKRVYKELEKRDIWRRLKEEIDRRTNGSGAKSIDFSKFFNGTPEKAYSDTLAYYADMLGKKIPGVKCPQNEFYYETIREWLPDYECKFIHLVRNPFDMVASFHISYYSDSIKRNPANVAVHAENWYRSVSLGLARAFYDPNKYYLLKYEDLAMQPEVTTRALCDFLEVDFDEKRMLNAEDYTYYGANTSFENQTRIPAGEFVREPQSRKGHLQNREKQVIGEICGELAKAVGYEDKDFRETKPERFVSRRSGLREIFSGIIGRFRK
jgi:hypothetical protein